ncbi:MAG: ABC transporter ATP-binding protein [Candidatus Thorarchaeota archaeon]|nr:MAG: ABC transporter ATP-binding protein [Candidatus Thorarchaeota archaeon]
MSDYAVSINNVTKSFGSVRALDDLSLNIDSCIFGLIGPNGAGKTTLLRILLGLIRPDNGTANILGHSILDRPEDYLEHVGVLHENPYYPPLMTARQYLTDVGLLYPDQIPVDEVLALVGLSEAADRKIRYLSAGMYRRLGLAQALVGRPRLILLDEPTSNLDITGRDLVMRLIVGIHNEEKVSFLITSHILSELERACHQVAIIVRGKIVEKGAIAELVERHTQCRFRAISSDSWKLEKLLKGEEGIVSVLVEGSKSLIIEVSSDYVRDMESRLEKAANRGGIQFYGIEATGTLEDVFRRLVSRG